MIAHPTAFVHMRLHRILPPFFGEKNPPDEALGASAVDTASPLAASIQQMSYYEMPILHLQRNVACILCRHAL